jgi:predicted Zn-dependent peptidase
MNFRLCSRAGRLAAGGLVVLSGLAQQVPVLEHTLSNGMKLLLVERHDEPTIAGAFVVHVGSANERPGITGIAHLFEHMMFKGTPTIGTRDYARDLEIIAEQERVREAIRAEERKLREAWRRGEIDDPQKPENEPERLRALRARFRELVEAQRAILVKNEFDRIYTSQGASGMNAFTHYDLTAYFITVPANKLELWLWMESERLLRPVFREFYAERDVVLEERRMRIESTPLGKFEESFNAVFWDAHPYHWPVIGWPSDLPAISKRDADEFYATYYAPQNITLLLVGDFAPETARAGAEKYFGRIPRGRTDPPEVVTWEPPQPAEKRFYAEAEANPQVDILWHTVPFGHRDSYALEVLAQLLSTRTGRLYKGLVLGREVATEVYARQESRRWAGLFNAGGEAREGRTPQQVEQAIYEELEKLKETPVPERELQKVKNNFAAAEYRKLTSNNAILFQLIFNEGLGDWREINAAGPKIQAVTAEDIQRVARKYFTRENRAVAIYTRKPGTGGDDPALAALPHEQRAHAKQQLAQLQAATDPAQLRALEPKLEQHLAQAPAEAKPLLELLLKRLRARLAELEAAPRN